MRIFLILINDDNPKRELKKKNKTKTKAQTHRKDV